MAEHVGAGLVDCLDGKGPSFFRWFSDFAGACVLRGVEEQTSNSEYGLAVGDDAARTRVPAWVFCKVFEVAGILLGRVRYLPCWLLVEY